MELISLVSYYNDIKNYFRSINHYKIGKYLVIFKRKELIFSLLYESKEILKDRECYDLLYIKNKFLILRHKPLQYLIITENELFQLVLKPSNNVTNLIQSSKNSIVIETNFIKIYYDCIKNTFTYDFTDLIHIYRIEHEYTRN